MSAAARLAAFAAVLALLFGGGALAGAVVDADAPGGETDGAAHGAEADAHGDAAGASHGAADPVRGLAVAEDGLRLVLDTPELRPGRAGEVRFRVLEGRGATVRDFDVEHTKRMHLIVARRDLTGFQHLHPEQDADGTWHAPLRLRDAGSYRVFADFSHDGEARTLAADLRVDGPADLRPLPEPSPVATSDGGHRVTLDAHGARAGQEAELRFTVTRDGRPVRTEPYLGAGGHLVALRDGDLAFLHVHPEEREGGRPIRFRSTFPTAGRYRLFLQYRVDGKVETVAFTQEVAR